MSVTGNRVRWSSEEGAGGERSDRGSRATGNLAANDRPDEWKNGPIAEAEAGPALAVAFSREDGQDDRGFGRRQGSPSCRRRIRRRQPTPWNRWEPYHRLFVPPHLPSWERREPDRRTPAFPIPDAALQRVPPLTLELTLLLIGIALLGGVCITTIGPGGIFVTIALHQLLAPGPGTVAGTASVTFIATGLIGTLAYLRSGELRGAGPTRAAVILSLTSVAGALFGSWLNTFLDSGSFGAILGLFVLATGLLILWRERRGFRRPPAVPPDSSGSVPSPTSEPPPRRLTAPSPTLDLTSRRGDVWMGIVGVAVGLPAGLLGVGGPVLAVPLLVMLGVPMLLAVGLAQVQSVLISLFASLGYAVQGVIDWGLALLVGIPLVVGTALGWWIAHRIRPARLKVGLAVVLVLLGLQLLLSGPPGG